MDMTQYIKPELLVLLPVLWVAGAILKRTPGIRDWLIPYLLLGASMLLCALYLGATQGFTGLSAFTGITQAFLIAGAAVGGNQLVKQAGKRTEEEKTDGTDVDSEGD